MLTHPSAVSCRPPAPASTPPSTRASAAPGLISMRSCYASSVPAGSREAAGGRWWRRADRPVGERRGCHPHTDTDKHTPTLPRSAEWNIERRFCSCGLKCTIWTTRCWPHVSWRERKQSYETSPCQEGLVEATQGITASRQGVNGWLLENRLPLTSLG